MSYLKEEVSRVELAIVIAIVVLTSWMTTKIITAKYFEVIDGYVKELLNDVLDVVGDATRHK